MPVLKFKPEPRGRISAYRSCGTRIAILSVPQHTIAITVDDATDVERRMLKSSLHDEKLKAARSAKALKLGLPHPPMKSKPGMQSDMTQPLDRQNKQAYTLGEVSLLMGFSRGTVDKLFKDEPGVIRMGHDETMHKRRYNSTRIPKHVYERVVRRLSQ